MQSVGLEEHGAGKRKGDCRAEMARDSIIQQGQARGEAPDRMRPRWLCSESLAWEIFEATERGEMSILCLCFEIITWVTWLGINWSMAQYKKENLC